MAIIQLSLFSIPHVSYSFLQADDGGEVKAFQKR